MKSRQFVTKTFTHKLSHRICAAVNSIELSNYKDSMSPLIKKDADELLKMLE